MKKITLLLLAMIFISSSFAQKIGSYDTTVNFMNAQRKVAIYVPTNYSANAQYNLMVMLHGLGDNVDNYRDVLVNGFKINTYLPNTIFICPEVYSSNNGYYNPVGGEEIIQKCIEFSKSIYNIDTENIFLQGLSVGGRDALRYGLDHYSIFKGLLINTPAAQGVKEALNLNSKYLFNYSNASKIPIYLTHGTADLQYQNVDDTIYKQLVLNDGIVRYYDFVGVGHTIPSFSKMTNLVSFFQQPTSSSVDVDIVELDVPERSCDLQVQTYCLLRSLGSDTITTININYDLNGNSKSYIWYGRLYPFQHTYISLPILNTSIGNQALGVHVDTINVNKKDLITANNDKSIAFQVVNKGNQLPLSEGFETATFPPLDWIFEGSGDYYGPFIYNKSIKKTGNGSLTAFNQPTVFDNSNRRQSLLSPLLDLTSLSNPHLYFDVAYNYARLVAPVGDSILSDTLEVYISTDCGATYSLLYKKGGTSLSTFSTPAFNPSVSFFINLTNSNYRTESIDLSSYSTCANATVKFVYVSGDGGAISIDNISFSNFPLSIPERSATKEQIYPNPANNTLYLESEYGDICVLDIIDIAGRDVMKLTTSLKQNDLITIDISSLKEGIYFLKKTTSNGTSLNKFLIQR